MTLYQSKHTPSFELLWLCDLQRHFNACDAHAHTLTANNRTQKLRIQKVAFFSGKFRKQIVSHLKVGEKVNRNKKAERSSAPPNILKTDAATCDRVDSSFNINKYRSIRRWFTDHAAFRSGSGWLMISSNRSNREGRVRY